MMWTHASRRLCSCQAWRVLGRHPREKEVGDTSTETVLSHFARTESTFIYMSSQGSVCVGGDDTSVSRIPPWTSNRG